MRAVSGLPPSSACAPKMRKLPPWVGTSSTSKSRMPWRAKTRSAAISEK